jgi:hypothetical protein
MRRRAGSQDAAAGSASLAGAIKGAPATGAPLGIAILFDGGYLLVIFLVVGSDGSLDTRIDVHRK